MALKFTKLTRAKISKLQPTDKNPRITEHGITFERLSNGDGKYSVNVMVDGQRIHRSIGMVSAGVTRKQAEEFVEGVKTDARAGRLNLPLGRKVVLGFRDAGKRYLEKSKEEGGKDLKAKKMRLTQHLIPFYKDKPLSAISTFDINRYKKFRLDANTAPGTINRELAVLSHLFTKAVEWKWLTHKPAVIKRLKEDPGPIVYLKQEQMSRLAEAAAQDHNPHVYPFVMIGLATGMRKMEILSIQIRNIDLKRRLIYIPLAKAGSREQPITNELANFLKEYIVRAKASQKWLFPSDKSETGHVVAIEKPYRRTVSRAGLDPDVIVRHTLRHTATSHLFQAGVDIPTIQKITGHKTVEMVMRYAHQDGEHIQQAMDKFESRIQVKSNGFSNTITPELQIKRKAV